ncbi:MAG: MBOAT family protein [Acidimicrobiia bacterium]|nr:MBOAT family protein [Acidimicrobiia bacterium]
MNALSPPPGLACSRMQRRSTSTSLAIQIWRSGSAPSSGSTSGKLQTPYSALSITDFWRRWHITLSNWFRDYLYIPLGGSRGTESQTRRNLIIVFLVTGLWHGANWTFIIWGAYHGAFLLIERATGQRALIPDHTAWFRRAYTFLVVCVGWVFFRSLNIGDAFSYLESMVGLHGWSGLSATVKLVADHRTVAMLIVAASTLALPQDWVTGMWLTEARPNPRVTIARFATVTVLFGLAVVAVMSSSFSPFLYFQF